MSAIAMESCVSSRFQPARRMLGALSVALAVLLPAAPTVAQVQRNFLNPSIEAPALTAANNAVGCYRELNETLVPGWSTTHPVQAGSGDCVAPGASSGRLIEMWRTNFQGVVARNGVNFAELNAEASSRMFQNTCLITGEQINWRFSHRGRGSATVRDVMDFNVGASLPIVRVGTTSNGAFNTPIASQGAVSTPASGGNGWVDYTGSFVYSGVTGTSSLGFESISTGSGSNTVGNFLDNIQIELRPFVEFTQSSSSTPEGASNNLPTLRLNGTVFTPFNVNVLITGGTAVLGTDFTTPGNSPTLTIAIPAGTYDGASAASLFALPITITQDVAVEGNETIELQVQPAGAAPPPYLVSSSTSCGGAAQTTWIYTIVDDDTRINLVKNAAAPVGVAGQPTQFDVVYTLVVNNPTLVPANYSLVDTPGLEANVNIVSASYTRNGVAGAALAGSGPWTLQSQWALLAAGATDTYVLTVRININRGGNTFDDACAAPSASGSGLHNSASAVLLGVPTNTTFTAAACRNTPTPVWVTLRKQLVGRAIASDQVQVRVRSGGNVTASATTSGSSAPATASTGLVVLPAGNTMQFDEAVKAAGTGPDQAPVNYGTQLLCTNANSASTTVLPSGTGIALATRQQWPEFTPAGGDDLDCLIINNPARAALSITKSNAAPSVIAGGTVNYTIVVSNAGPAAANGAVVRDPAVTGLNCTTATCGTQVNGATCPAATGSALASALQSGAGAIVGALPANSALTFTLTCAVTATGLP